MAILRGLNSADYKVVKGLCQDLEELSSLNNTAFSLFNLKNQVIGGKALNALTNEKGTVLYFFYDELIKKEVFINGIIIGIILCTSEKAVIFTKEPIDYIENNPNGSYGYENAIYLVYTTNLEKVHLINLKELARGQFNFGSYIAGVFCFENSEILKVYWVDGKNQLRYINIASSEKIIDENKLNSTPSFKFNHRISVERVSGGGVFTAGVILYCFTYFNKYGAETNIVDMTPLYYISEDSRGIANDEKVGCLFKVTILGYDNTDFDYLRLYSILRTSINGEPIVKIVRDIKLKNTGLEES